VVIKKQQLKIFTIHVSTKLLRERGERALHFFDGAEVLVNGPNTHGFQLKGILSKVNRQINDVLDIDKKGTVNVGNVAKIAMVEMNKDSRFIEEDDDSAQVNDGDEENGHGEEHITNQRPQRKIILPSKFKDYELHSVIDF